MKIKILIINQCDRWCLANVNDSFEASGLMSFIILCLRYHL
nr:MAG TPA: hypothetical protein [Caudoviricetes sp.]